MAGSGRGTHRPQLPAAGPTWYGMDAGRGWRVPPGAGGALPAGGAVEPVDRRAGLHFGRVRWAARVPAVGGAVEPLPPGVSGSRAGRAQRRCGYEPSTTGGRSRRSSGRRCGGSWRSRTDLDAGSQVTRNEAGPAPARRRRRRRSRPAGSERAAAVKAIEPWPAAMLRLPPDLLRRRWASTAQPWVDAALADGSELGGAAGRPPALQPQVPAE